MQLRASWLLFLAVGLWTRVAAVATWFLYVATIQRNLISFNGETGILAFVLLGLAFAPAPQRLSIDHLVLKRPLPMHGRSVAGAVHSAECLLDVLFYNSGEIARFVGSRPR